VARQDSVRSPDLITVIRGRPPYGSRPRIQTFTFRGKVVSFLPASSEVVVVKTTASLGLEDLVMRGLFGAFTIVALISTTLTSETSAQPKTPTGGRASGFGLLGVGYGSSDVTSGLTTLNLAQSQAVQEELKLKDYQKAQIKTLAESVHQTVKSKFQEMHALSEKKRQLKPGDHNPYRDQFLNISRELRSVTDQDLKDKLSGILDRVQHTRLEQIQLQLEGPFALVRPEIIEKLSLDDDQIALISGLIHEVRMLQAQTKGAVSGLIRWSLASRPATNPEDDDPDADGKVVAGRPIDPTVREKMKGFWDKPETKAKMKEFGKQEDIAYKQFMRSVNRILTKRQRAIYQKLIGPPFDLSKVVGGTPWSRTANAEETGQ
jgi:hypothetical protein